MKNLLENALFTMFKHALRDAVSINTWKIAYLSLIYRWLLYKVTYWYEKRGIFDWLKKMSHLDEMVDVDQRFIDLSVFK